MIRLLALSILAVSLGISLAKEQAEGSLESSENKPGAEVCRYKKGVWSTCNQLTQLETRDDQLKVDKSSSECSKTRQITRNCKKDKRNMKTTPSKKGLCLYHKSREATWSECKSGVKTKTLKLITDKDHAGCPSVKHIARKCKNKGNKSKRKEKKRIEKEEKKKKKMDHKKDVKLAEKCEFGPWSVFSPCSNGFKLRRRQVVRGDGTKICVKHSVQKVSC